MSDLLSERHDGIGVVTLNRPDRLNAIGSEMLDALGRTRPPRFAGR
jgi:enoyl-CoA hydratase/carnithine racemase